MESLPSRSSSSRTDGYLSRERMKIAVLAGITLIALYLTYKLLLPFFPALAWATALAIVANPLHNRLCRRLRRPGLAAGATVLIVTVLIIAPMIFLSQQLVAEATQAAQRARTEHWGERLDAHIQSNPRLSTAYGWVKDRFRPGEQLQRVVGAVSSAVPSLLAGSAAALGQLLVALFSLFFFFRDKGQAIRAIRSYVPMSPDETDEFLQRITDAVSATITGHVLVHVLQGILGGLMFWFLGLPGPLLWGTIMAVLSLVPVLGAFIVWVPAAIYLVMSGAYIKALILTLWGVLVIGSADNILFPLLVGGKLRMHTLPVFFAILGGLGLFGMSGIILGPVTLAVTLALLEVWRERTAGNRMAEREPRAA